MYFSSAKLVSFALALTGVLAAPKATEIVQDDGITLKLLEGNIVQRIGVDGKLLGETKIGEEYIEQFAELASQSQSQRRDTNPLIQRQCLYGHPCSSDEICYYNGCSGCLFVATGVGGCV